MGHLLKVMILVTLRNYECNLLFSFRMPCAANIVILPVVLVLTLIPIPYGIVDC